MPEVTIDIRRLPNELRRRLKHDTALLRQAALEAAIRGQAEAVERTNEAGLVDTGHFKNAWHAAPLPKGAELRNDAPYASVIEHGRRPGRPGPPIDPIREWVQRKLVKNGVVEPKKAERVAQAIRQAIHKRGTPPRLILGGIVPDLRRWFREEALRRLERGG